MRSIISFLLGLYLTVAIVVFASAAWGFTSDARWKNKACASNWAPWAAYRAIAWPKAYFDDAKKLPPEDIAGWLLVEYDPWGTCS